MKELKTLVQHMDIARTEIQETLADLAKGGISLVAVHIILLEGVASTEKRMRESGTNDQGIANCKLVAMANLESGK